MSSGNDSSAISDRVILDLAACMQRVNSFLAEHFAFEVLADSMSSAVSGLEHESLVPRSIACDLELKSRVLQPLALKS